MDWQPIETVPGDGFYLVYGDGAVRTMAFFDGAWELPDIPVLIDKVGNRLVSRELQELRGERLEIAGGVYEPTLWAPIELPA